MLEEPPSSANSELNGAALAPEPEASEPPSGPDAAPRAEPGGPLPPSPGEPGAAPPTFCRKCQVEVRPQGKGQCPRCGTFLRLNFVARRHPVNVLRRDALLADLLRQFPPANIVERSTCEHLAATLEQLETMRPGTTEWQRLVTAAQTLGAALHDPRETRASSSFPGVERMPTSALGAARDLLTRHARGETLSEFDRGRLSVLRSALHGELVLPPDPTASSMSDSPTVAAEPDSCGPTEIAPVETTRASDMCPYCHQRPCVGRDHHAYEALHHDDPAEVERRRQEATAVMLKTMAHGSGITRW
jgi:hypothetical protein